MKIISRVLNKGQMVMTIADKKNKTLGVFIAIEKTLVNSLRQVRLESIELNFEYKK